MNDSNAVGAAALCVVLHRYLLPCIDPTPTVVELATLTYFLRAAGEPIPFDGWAWPKFPSAALVRLVSKLDMGDLGEWFRYLKEYPTDATSPLELHEWAADVASSSLPPESMNRIDCVAKLIDGWESPHGLRLLLTVHATRKQIIPISSTESRGRYPWVDSDLKTRVMRRTLVLAQLSDARDRREVIERQVDKASSWLEYQGWL